MKTSRILLILLLLLFVAGTAVGLYFLWRPKVDCDWQDRACDYAQGCLNQACLDAAGNVTKTQCSKVDRCKTAPPCDDWQNRGCDIENQCMIQICGEDENTRQCIQSAKCQNGTAGACPTGYSLKNQICYAVCPPGTTDKGDYCHINIDNFCPKTTTRIGHECYKKEYDPKTQQCVPKWLNADCDRKTQQTIQINSCTGQTRTVDMYTISTEECCPRWSTVGCDYKKYCTKVTDECGTAADTCFCNDLYKDCCRNPAYPWEYLGGYIKNKGQNEYLYYYVKGGGTSELTFDLGVSKVIIQPEQLTGYLYVTIPPFGGLTRAIYGYLTRSSQIDMCDIPKNCENRTFRVKKVYPVTLPPTADSSKSVWAYNQATGEIVDNIDNPKIKLTATQMTDQAGDNYGMSAAAVSYTTKKTDYDIWFYEKVPT
uniref:Uncharacterized protein n=1 Tax=Marseillevirus LCMAC202 TaxID=2506606 RepID=A0A481YY55_9VIRU|nr:MAG: hypothetical protein LCMAC202_05450 [Marseillevirus LCMAC202]